MRTDYIELVEETDLVLPKDKLGEAQALSLYRDPHFEFEWPNPGNNFHYRLRSKGWVGHIPVGDTVIVVRPKAPVASIFAMLEVAYDLKSFNILEGETAVETLEEIYERVAAILAKRVNDRFRKGLYRGYIDKNDDLEYLRGRLDIRGNIRNALLTAPRLRCRYQELTADLDENIILLWALYLVSRTGLSRDDVKRTVRQAYRHLIGAVSLEPRSSSDCVDRFYHRLNEDYKPIHGLCRFIIEHAGPGIKVAGHEFLPFSLDMAKLFEEFMAKWLDENLPGNLKVDPQFHVQLDANADLSFKIDLVLRDRLSGQALALIDVKYKMDEQPSEDDIQQVVAYAVELGVSRAHLVYPFSLPHPVKAKIGNLKVSTIGIDLSRPFTEAWDTLAPSIIPSDLMRAPATG
jgi:5-methylcytosine-specific restriction enzyme subunit McrC